MSRDMKDGVGSGQVLREVLAGVLLVVSIWSLWLALTLPLFTVVKSVDLYIATLEDATSFGVFSTIGKAYDTGNRFLAGVILVFTVILPIVKLLVLSVLYLAVGLIPPKRAAKIGDFLERIGRWAMLDVLMVAIGITLYTFRSWGSVITEVGLHFFTASVLGTMAAGWQITRLAAQARDAIRLSLVPVLGLFLLLMLLGGGGAWTYRDSREAPVDIIIKQNRFFKTPYLRVSNLTPSPLLNVQIHCLSLLSPESKHYRIDRLGPNAVRDVGGLWCISQCPGVEEGVDVSAAGYLTKRIYFKQQAE